MEDIIDIILKIVAMLLALGAGYLGKFLMKWIKENVDAKTAEKLDVFVAELVAAAEQLYKKDDPDGSERLAYVQEQLIEAGYEITEAVRALIEAKVFEINITSKAVN